MNRRDWIKGAGAGVLGSQTLRAEEKKEFRLHYVLSSAMYGTLPLEQVLASVKKTGANTVDIWRKVHATHREQITEMGDEEFQDLLNKHNTEMSVSTCYPLGPFRG